MLNKKYSTPCIPLVAVVGTRLTEEKERGENTEIELEAEGRKRSEVGRGINQEPRKVRMCLCASEFLVTLRYLSTEDII